MSTPGTMHRARNNHRCDAYFETKCVGDGWIVAGEKYFSPSGDCKDPFHPYRVCKTCLQRAGKKAEITTKTKEPI
jgi:hypothetical protein